MNIEIGSKLEETLEWLHNQIEGYEETRGPDGQISYHIDVVESALAALKSHDSVRSGGAASVGPLSHGVIDSLESALAASLDAENEDLKGKYPAALIVLARAFQRVRHS